MDLLAKYGFDLKERVGYFMWSERRFDFNSMKGLRNAYEVVFGADGKSWFRDDQFEELSTLEAIRHVLVHRGGRVDQFFRDRVKRHPTYSMLPLDEQIQLDGAVALWSMNMAAVCGAGLLRHVDDWLSDHET